jgi:NADPH2:quinone reductase
MKALLCKALDGPDALEITELPSPEAAPGQVTIKVEAVALNFFDSLMVRGKYQHRPPLPFSPGGEVAGVVQAVGPGVTALTPGNRVFAYVKYNGCREEITVDAKDVTRIPDGLSTDIAATIPIAYGTALHGLEDRGQVKAGETVLVLGATGGAGLAAIEVALKLGARVVAAGTSDDKLQICKERGAHETINLSAVTDLKDHLRKMTGDSGIEVIYDCIGGPYAEPALRNCAWEGRYLVIGFAAGDIPKIPLNLLLLKGCALVGVFWGRHVERDPHAFTKQMARLAEWAAEGAIRPHIDHVFPLEETAKAIRMIEKREIKGKVVIRP